MFALTERLLSPRALKIVSIFEFVFGGLPKLPKNIAGFFANLSPFIALLGIVFGIVGGPVLFVLSLLSVVTLDLALIMKMIVTTFFVGVNTIVLIRAFRPLWRRDMRGWVLLFWGNILGDISIISAMYAGTTRVPTGVIVILLGFYLLFQMKRLFQASTPINVQQPWSGGVRQVSASQPVQQNPYSNLSVNSSSPSFPPRTY